MKILVADDDPLNRHLLQGLLTTWGYEMIFASDGEEAWQILRQKNAPKLAILDWMMPGKDGTEICREIRNYQDSSYTYILLLTANLDKEDIITGLEAGADDYLTKPFNPNELRARLRAGRRIIELQEQLHAAYEQLRFQAAHDTLTGVKSRAAILEALQAELARARRRQDPVGILLADLDRFKEVNDTFGHLAGDAVLRETAKRMLSSVRSYDTVGRYGGEEFLIVVPGCDVSSLVNRAEALRMAVAAESVKTREGLISITVSLGVTVGGGSRPTDVEPLLRAADTALYQAKNNGRNRVEVFEQGPDPSALLTGDFRSPTSLPA